MIHAEVALERPDLAYSKTTALIDSDIIAYRCAAASENDSEEEAVLRAESLVSRILADAGAHNYISFLSGKNNFRKSVCPDYKANRTKPPPVHLEAVRQYLYTEYNSKICDGYEADDAIGIEQTKLNKENPLFTSVICSIDKDLQQIAGRHYNFVKGSFFFIEKLEGLQQFYKQLLIGDVSDNIKGVAGIGPVKAAKAISFMETEEEMFEYVRSLYNDDERLLKNGKLLWIWKKENDLWKFPCQ